MSSAQRPEDNDPSCRKSSQPQAGNPRPGKSSRTGPAGSMPSVGAARAGIDQRALLRMIQWSLDINERQRQYLQSALEVLLGESGRKQP